MVYPGAPEVTERATRLATMALLTMLVVAATSDNDSHKWAALCLAAAMLAVGGAVALTRGKEGDEK
jgi:hypothetical protein